MRRAGNDIDIDDVIQETYSILAALDAFEAVQFPRAYLFQTARSVLLKQVRRARIVRFDALDEMGDDSLHDPSPLPDVIVQDRQTLKNLEAAIACLPKQSRRALVLRKVEGLSQQQIAAQMGLSESTVEKHLARAIQQLLKWRRDGGNAPSQVSTRKNTQPGADHERQTHEPADRRTGRRMGSASRQGRTRRL